MGLIDASKPRSYTPRKGLLAPVLDQTTTTGSMESQSIGGETTNGDPRGGARDQASYGSFSEMMNDPGFRGDWGKVAGMMSPTGSLIMDLLTGNDQINGNANMGAANTGMNNAGGVPNPELAGRSDPSQGGGGTPGGPPGGGWGGSGVEGDRGFLYKGGKVPAKGLLGNVDPPGPDNVLVAAKTGERILNAQQFASLSKEARAEVERALKAKK